jgi:hypothetical protein
MIALSTYTVSRTTEQLCHRILKDLTDRLSPNITYHDVNHTIDVVDTCYRYTKIYQLDERQVELLLLAATGHDYGFLISPENHEHIGADLITIFMTRYNFDIEAQDIVKGLIMATRIPQHPNNMLEAIIADADLDYLGRTDYPLISDKLFQELKYYNKIQSEEDWRELQIKFLSSHRYHTSWAKENREPAKQRRLEAIKQSR